MSYENIAGTSAGEIRPADAHEPTGAAAGGLVIRDEIEIESNHEFS
jgi:hypothetical protein